MCVTVFAFFTYLLTYLQTGVIGGLLTLLYYSIPQKNHFPDPEDSHLTTKPLMVRTAA